MTSNKKVDYLIVGQGIAGSLLSYFLMKRNKTFLVINKYDPNSSSNIAAGLFNPITGRRIVKTWKADLLLPFAETTYHELEEYLDALFYHKKNIFKVFTSVKEQNDWISKSEFPEFKNYVLPKTNYSLGNKNIRHVFGGFEITNSGCVDIALFLILYKERLIQNGLLTEEIFNYSDIKITDETISWKNIKANKILFCEGYKAINNPYFDQLPFVLTKGELLTIHAPDLALDKIVSRGIFLLPLGNNNYKVGSTYTWNEVDEIPTEKGKKDLLEKLDTIICCPYEVVDHKAGVRPTVKDRRPFIGVHPTCRNMGIFNGMGTKGASLAPYFAHHFVSHLEDGTELDKEVDIKRFEE